MDQWADDFVHSLYGAVLEADLWPVAASRLAALAEAPSAAIMDSDFAAGVVHRQAL